MTRIDYSLVGVDGNAFSIMGYVKGIMKKEKYPQSEIDAYLKDAQSEDYNHLVSVSLDKIHEINAKKRGKLV